MMQFRTKISLPSFSFGISHQDQLFSMGSCFAENMGQRLARQKFKVNSNPFGILYNPVSIQVGLQMLLKDYQLQEKDFVQHQGLWHSFYHHGAFSGIGISEVMAQIKRSNAKARKALLESNRLLITLGTSQIFMHREKGEVVANCHKLPAANFIKRRLTVPEVVLALSPIFKDLQAQNTDLQIIVTVSPIRHLRDDLHENQLNKATLLLALEQLCKELDYVHYFPSYEILLDDLRDYRFYERDMAHPNTLATDYIWRHFQEAFFSGETQHLNQRIEKIVRASEHRPLHPTTTAHQLFKKKQLEKIAEMKRTFSFLDFEEERAIFSSNH